MPSPRTPHDATAGDRVGHPQVDPPDLIDGKAGVRDLERIAHGGVEALGGGRAVATELVPQHLSIAGERIYPEHPTELWVAVEGDDGSVRGPGDVQHGPEAGALADVAPLLKRHVV
jgi:hypothetical protein